MPARSCRSFLTSPAKNARIRSHIRRTRPPRRFLRTAGFACSSSLCSAGSGSFACLSSNRSASPCSPSVRMPSVFCSPSVGGHPPHCALRVLLHRPPGHPLPGFSIVRLFPFRVIPKIRSCEENPSSSYAASSLPHAKSHVTAIRTVVFSPMLPLFRYRTGTKSTTAKMSRISPSRISRMIPIIFNISNRTAIILPAAPVLIQITAHKNAPVFRYTSSTIDTATSSASS